ncbi:MAG: PQQ-dependent sugar dehydrogenase [Ignavibacteriaceae bacterium]
MNIRYSFILIILITLLCDRGFSQYTLQDAFPNLTFQRAVDLQHAGDLSDRLFIVDQLGAIKVIQNDATVNSTKNFLDITDSVVSGGERGLLGLAFHPEYENNGYFYVNYTTGTTLKSRISRFSVSTTNTDSADKNSELILLEYDQPFTNHNGGQLAFGNDGYLYIASGDGGSGGDPQNNAQNISVLLGKILRIDVDNPQTPLNYGIPSDNPFVDSSGSVRKEIFAYGLRNPWRFSIDPITENIWCGDVGQNSWEEIDIIQNGKNYGWKCYEGNDPYNLTGCNGTYEFPIWEYSHSVGFSITGGYVYRGPNLPDLYGKYIYADYVMAKIWSLEYDGVNPAINNLLLTAPGSVTSFGVDQNQELYVLSFNGKIYRFTPTALIVAPSYLRINSQVNGEINLQWKDNSNNETGFIIERQTDLTEVFVTIDSVDANVTNFTDFISDTAFYTYRIKAYDVSNQSGYSNQAAINVTIIPVELTSFTAETVTNGVKLKWQTATELNNKGFEVHRKIDNNEWFTVSFVEGNGTTAENKSYIYIDNLSMSNKVTLSYRLKQIDFNGDYSYSSEIKINLISPDNYSLEQNYPNPFNPSTVIRYSLPDESNVSLKVFDVLGNEIETLINKQQTAGSYEINFNASKLSNGIYFYQVTANGFSKTLKMIVLK